MHVELLLTFAAIASAPLWAAAAARAPRWESVGEGFTVVTVAGLVLLQVVPFGIRSAGWFGFIALLFGLLVAQAVHHFPRAEGVARWVACVGLLVHGLIDGAALALETVEPQAEGVGWAVVVHSLPVGVATWRLGLSMGGALAGGTVLALSVLATGVGFAASGAVLEGSSGWVLAVAQCALAGMLLHALGHLADPAASPVRTGVGAVAGVAVLALVGAESPFMPVAGSDLSASAKLLAFAAPALLVLLVASALRPALVALGARLFRGSAQE